MRFVSKSANLLIVLRPGLSAQPITGTPAVPTVSVRFKDGIADVQQQELVDMMLTHSGYNSDYISAEVDPYAAARQASEPTHVMTDLKFGTPVNRLVGGGNPIANLTPDMQKALQSMALEMAKSMMPSMLKELVKAHEAEKQRMTATENPSLTKAGRPKKKPGRKAKKVVAQHIPSAEENPLIQPSVS